MTLDLWTAIVLALAGFFLGFREIVLSPRNETFPHAPRLVRCAMFALAALLAGSALLFAGEAPIAGAYAGKAAPLVLAFAVVQALYNAVLLANLLRQRYRPEVWRRLNRAAETVKRSCPELRPAFPAPLHVARRR